jgi:hypothetical protein
MTVIIFNRPGLKPPDSVRYSQYVCSTELSQYYSTITSRYSVVVALDALHMHRVPTAVGTVLTLMYEIQRVEPRELVLHRTAKKN